MNPIGTKKELTTIMLSMLMAILLVSQPGRALPKYNKSNHINDFQSFAIARDSLLAGSQIMADDASHKIYISPSSKKSQTGQFQPLATSACHVLADHYQLTYLMPDISPEQYVDFAKNGPFSSFFDAKLGNYVRHSGVLNQIVGKISEIDRIKQENQDIIIAYETAKINFEQAQKEFDAADAAYNELTEHIVSLRELLTETDDNDERVRLETALQEARRVKEEEGPELKERLRLARREVHAIRPVYANAKATYDATIPDVEQISADIKSLSSIFEAIHEISIRNYEANERALKAFENATVGLASASYSIWGDEASRLQDVLSEYSNRSRYFMGYSVSRLPIHNVRLKKPVSSNTSSGLSGHFNGDTSTRIASMGMASDGLLVAHNSEPAKYPVFTKDAQAVVPEIKTLAGDGAGTYQNLITRGALCTGNSERKNGWSVSTIFKSGDLEIENNFEVHVYQPRTTNVLAQSVALEYDFYARSEPTKVSCSLDTTKFSSLVASSGTGGFLFWRTSWSETERRKVEQSGIICKVKLSPSGENPDHKEQNRYVESIRQAMMQEIAAEFILTYAKSWEISQRQPAIPNPGNAAFKAGAALMTLCGENIYCAVTGIILKTGNELFGSNASKANNRDFMSGSIYRSYEESSWTVSNGQAVIDLTVPL